ncbi:MAG: hypothetical protein KC776_38495 [Myxococcales bacterium]|nr:hypothetical protein [Myxococcales bacterium]
MMLSALFIGCVGCVLVVYGKRMARVPHLAAGALMLVYPYFVSSALLSLGIFAVLVGVLVAAVRFGY